MTSEATIREARAEDAGSIHGLILELAEYERMSDEVVATVDDIATQLFGPDPAAACLIAERDGAVCGFALYFRTFSTFVGRPGLHLEDLYVKPEARGRGIGRALLMALAARCAALGYGRLEWSVLDWNAPAIAFYESLGAARLSEWFGFRLADSSLARAADEGANISVDATGSAR